RETDAEGYDPDFEAPLYPVIPILGAIFSFGLVAFMAPVEILLSMLFVVFGVVWYVIYARKNARKGGVLSRYIEA
ncbi:MAG: amino acid transporter, partial [Halodesulfurarchaeum sp.]|nr:amino acid transporter [Halodesulfurarchaeum sp.]